MKKGGRVEYVIEPANRKWLSGVQDEVKMNIGFLILRNSKYLVRKKVVRAENPR